MLLLLGCLITFYGYLVTHESSCPALYSILSMFCMMSKPRWHINLLNLLIFFRGVYIVYNMINNSKEIAEKVCYMFDFIRYPFEDNMSGVS